MIRTTIRIATAALVTLAASLVPAAIAQAKPKHCQPGGSQTLAANNYARAYAQNGKAYVCIKSSGKRTLLANSTPGVDKFALGGKYVGWTSTDPSDPSEPPNDVITVMHIPDHALATNYYPFHTNEQVTGLVVVSDGAAAWALNPLPGDDQSNPIVQGTDRKGHPPDQFSDDSEGTNVVGSSLHVISGKTIGWSYADGKTGTQVLY
jgi:hypothetical protein